MGYDVFMSFRGEDTRMSFTSHLYDALTRNDMITYKDDETLEIGNPIAAELLEAIETSRFAVVVLSSSFATSKWCLEEIAKIVDCMKRGKLTVIPVFYHVSPSDVRHQSNCFEKGFADHEVDPQITPQKVETWRAAFTELGAVAGLHVTRYRNESEVISEIVRKILKDMPDTLPINLSNGLVGISSRVDEVIRILRMDSSEVLFIGICGMSGIGKTTLAEVVYMDIHNKFENYSFIENIKDISKKNDSIDLCKLQQKLLDDILKETSTRVQHVKHGQTLLGTKLRGLKVIIVLDDVNHVDQLTYLAGGREWFGRGSRIIVTTTNADLLKSHEVSDIYVCEEMRGDEALRLFCLSAFKQSHPKDGYEKLSDDMVMLAGGLPLALNVYGSHLCGKETNYWNEMLEKLREYPEKEVLGRLKVVYARLDRNELGIFIYIACFLKGRNIDLVKDILSNIGLYPECGIADLMNKFLITINLEDNVWMHDMLQQMCWEVLCEESHIYDGKHIAIKKRQYIVDVFSSIPKGTQTIEIINQEPYKVEMDCWFDDSTCFSNMRKLKFLRISNIHFHHGLNYLSNDLRILEWYGCSLKSFPSTFEPKHMYELEMCSSQLKTLWEKDLDLPNLRSIDLSFSKELMKIPDLTSTLNLVRLNLEGCTNLTELHESVLLHRRVRYLNLKGCTSLQTLAGSIMKMEALEALVLSGCSNLESIPEFGQNMKQLEHLYVDGTAIKKLPDNLGQMCDLRKLDASGTLIEELPSSIHRLRKLRLLHVNRCRLSFKTGCFLHKNLDTLSSGLREVDLSYCNLFVIPDGIGLLHHLIHLDLSGNEFVSLPASIALLSKLRMLWLNNCKRLQSLPKLSLADEDTDYEPRSRFTYYVSAEGSDASKDHGKSNTSLTISCLNCPKLAENEPGSCFSEKILNNYLQLRSNHWSTPEALFEIVGAGGIIPPKFKLLRSNEYFIHQGPWIGVALCAVMTLGNIDACMEEKYVVTVHIYVNQKHWSISVPVNFLTAGLENQLVLYWTIADDAEGTLNSTQEKWLLWRFSFKVELGDSNLQLTRFGVLIIRDEDILQLTRHEDSTCQVVKELIQAVLFLPSDMQWYIRACEANTDLPAGFDLIIRGLARRMIKFTDDNRQRQYYSLNDTHQFLKCLFESKRQVLSEWEEWKHSKLFPLVCEYYRISQGTSELYSDFVLLLKDILSSWLSVKVALEQIVARIRAGNYTREVMLEHLNDLEAAKGVRFSHNFVLLFAYICKQTVDFSRRLNMQLQGMKKFKLLKLMAKASSIDILVVWNFVAPVMGHNELLQETKDITSYSEWLQKLKQSLLRKRGRWFLVKIQQIKGSFSRDLCISDFYSNAHLLTELKSKVAQSNRVINEYEKELMVVIDELQKKINSCALTIEDMGNSAHNYSLVIRKAGMRLHEIAEVGNYPPVTKFGVSFISEEVHVPKRDEAVVSEAMNLLYQVTASIPNDLPWYVCACGADRGLHSCHSIIHDHTSSQIRFFINYSRQRNSLDGIQKIFECIQAVSTKSSQLPLRWFRSLQHAFEFYEELTNLLKDISDSWLRVKLAMEKIVVKSRAEEFTSKKKILLQLSNAGYMYFSYSSYTMRTSIEFFFHSINSDIMWKHVEEIQRASIIGVMSVMATYVGDSGVMAELGDITSDSMLLDLIKRISKKDGEWFDDSGKVKRRSNDEELQIWDSHASVFLDEFKKKMDVYDCFNQEMEVEMLMVIDKLDTNITAFSETIEEMCKHSHLCLWDLKSMGLFG